MGPDRPIIMFHRRHLLPRIEALKSVFLPEPMRTLHLVHTKAMDRVKVTSTMSRTRFISIVRHCLFPRCSVKCANVSQKFVFADSCERLRTAGAT